MRTIRSIAMAVALAAALASAAPSAPSANGPASVYHAARIWTGVGEPIDDGVLVVEDGLITAVGRRGEVPEPPRSKRVDLGAAVIVPGLIAAHTSLAEGGRDDEWTLTPDLRAADGFDPFDDYTPLLAAGVTTVQVSPGSRRLMPGQGAVVKLAGGAPERRTLVDSESLRVLLGSASLNPPRIYDAPIPPSTTENPIVQTQAQIATSRAGQIAALRAILRAARRNLENDSAPADATLDAVAAAMVEGRFRITAPTAVDIAAALSLADEFDLDVTLVDPEEVHYFKDDFKDWAARGIAVVLAAEIRPGELDDAPIPDPDAPARPPIARSARELVEAGVTVAIRPADDEDLAEFLFVGGTFMQHGLSAARTLRMMTADAAKALGVADRVGSLAPGLDADFVVMSDDPFATRAYVREVFVNGQSVHRSASADPFTVVRVGNVITGDGRTIPGGAVAFQGGKLRAVGADVSAPADAIQRNFKGAVIIPGMIDMNATAAGQIQGNAQLQTTLADSLEPGDPALAVARQGGVTTSVLMPGGAGPSPVLAYKLGDDARAIAEPVAVRFEISGNLTQRIPQVRGQLEQGKAYADSWTAHEKAMAEYQVKLEEWEAAQAARPTPTPAAEAQGEGEGEQQTEEQQGGRRGGRGGGRGGRGGGAPGQRGQTPPTTEQQGGQGEGRGEQTEQARAEQQEPQGPPRPEEPTAPRRQPNMEPYRALFAGRIPAIVSASRDVEIAETVKLFRDRFDLRLILQNADDAFRRADELSAKKVSVIVGPQFVDRVDRETVNYPQAVVSMGSRIAFQSGGRTASKNLPMAVTHAVRNGLGVEDALSGLTAWPAEMLGLHASIGSLKAGGDADFVVLSGPPFELATRVLAVVIDGRWVYQAEELRP